PPLPACTTIPASRPTFSTWPVALSPCRIPSARTPSAPISMPQRQPRPSANPFAQPILALPAPWDSRPVRALSVSLVACPPRILTTRRPFPPGPPPAPPFPSMAGQPAWRAGLAYEIPEYALRVSAIYNAPLNYTLDGTAYGGAASANVTTPQSFEIRGQTGIAPGWLALGSVKWMDWSVLQRLTVSTINGPRGSAFDYRDGWTVTAGIGHAVNEQLSVVGILSWDRGTSTPGAGGVLTSGTQTDRYGISLGGSYSFSPSVQLTGGVSASTLGAGSNARGERWDTGYVFAVSGGLKGSF